MFLLPKGTTLDLKLQIDTTLLIMASVVTCDPQVGNGIKFTKMLAERAAGLSTVQRHLPAWPWRQQQQPGSEQRSDVFPNIVLRYAKRVPLEAGNS